MKPYEKGRLPQIIWGSGSAERVATELQSIGTKKCLIVSGRHVVKHAVTRKVIASLQKADIVCGVFDRVLPEPTDLLCLEIAREIKRGQYDCVLGIGGGSPMDAAKAASLIAGIPEEIEDLHEYGKTGTRMKEAWHRTAFLVLMPTTSGTGAETTASAVISSVTHGMKFSFGNRNTAPDLCIIDPDFTIGMPPVPTALGGADALAHTIEILVGTGANAYTDTILLSCLEKIWTWLPTAVREPENREAREALSWAAHNALANGGVPNGHAFAHAVGSLYHVVHGHACMLVLPSVIRHFARTAENAIREIALRIGVPVTGDAETDARNTAEAIRLFAQTLGMKPLRETLQENGFPDDEETFIEKMIPLVMDDFKSRQWLPPIHGDDYREKVGKICSSIYEEKQGTDQHD